ncbi:MAG: hypothetical protein IGS03_07390 [Candidatus Sericytochromatia bacterium]|nr:hypothetical protein [Candidatus Sericytochromatia bacterium]
MKLLKIMAAGCLSLLLVRGQAAAAPAVAEQPPALETYQPRYISFYQAQQSQLDAFLVRFFQRELPRFDYPLILSEGSLPDFLARARQYQSEQAGLLAAGQTPEDLRFGERVVTWSQTRQVLDSAYVFAPRWAFSPLEISGPEYSGQTEGQGWYLVLKSRFSLDLPLYKVREDQPQALTAFQENWQIVKLLRMDMPLLRQRMQDELGASPAPEDTAAFLTTLRRLPPFDQLLPALESQDPARYLQDTARKVLELELSSPEKMAKLSDQALVLGLSGSLNLLHPDGLKQSGAFLEGVSALYKLQNLLAEIRKTPEFQLKGQVSAFDPQSDLSQLSLSESESVSSLGIHLDAGYRIIEYRQTPEGMQPVEIGFTKVRALEEQQFSVQTILAARPFEPGDQHLEYPKTPFELRLRGGTGSLALLGPRSGIYADTAPEFSGTLYYSLAQALGWSETYLGLNGAYGMVGWPGVRGRAPPANVSALTGELGLSKRFYFRQLMLAVGLRLGFMNGVQSDGPSTLSQSTLGGTPFAGAALQLNPDLILGLDLGWREYPAAGTRWRSSAGDSDLCYGLAASGPVFGLFLNYQL